MCGIAGIFQFNKTREFDRVKATRELLLSIEAQNKHTTDYAYIDREETIIEKADLRTRDFIETADLFTRQRDLPKHSRTILLHTRYATQGTPKNNHNNHPIHNKFSGMTLIHNG